MSFILDALRKAEIGRRDGPAVVLPDMPRGEIVVPREPPAWRNYVAGLVVLLGLLVAGVWFVNQRAAPSAAGPLRAGPAPERVTAAAAQPARTAVRPLDREANRGQPPSVAPGVAPVPVQTLPEPATARAATRPARVLQAPQMPDLPDYRELRNSGIKLPELTLDMHVYSSEPAKRVVFINMRKYNEGDKLENGVRLNAITTEGALLEQGGRQFLLSN